jgi:hypothetical protein
MDGLPVPAVVLAWGKIYFELSVPNCSFGFSFLPQ